MEIITFGDEHITTYKFCLDGKVFLLDFGSNKIRPGDVSDVDYIFLSHEHLDHCHSLTNFDVVKDLKPTCRIFSSRTTKRIIEHIVLERLETIGAPTKEKKNISSLIERIEISLFGEEIKLTDTLKAYLYRSGHTFGSSMVYICGTKKILYTGDIDFVANDASRQYDLPYNLYVDYMIVDGTNIFSKEYKGIRDNSFVEYISRKRGKTLKYYARPEKAIFYALHLASKVDDCIFLYSDYMRWYLKIITEEGYNPYILEKVCYKMPLVFSVEYAREFMVNGRTVIEFTGDDSKYNIDSKMSLHISKYELKQLIDEHICNDVCLLVGHYETGAKLDDIVDVFPNSVLLLEEKNNVK